MSNESINPPLSAIDKGTVSAMNALLALDNPQARSGALLLDVEYYRSRYPDVAASAVDPLWHYLNWGAAEGRYPMSPQSVDHQRVIRALEIDSLNGMAQQLHLLFRLSSERFSTVAQAIAECASTFGTLPQDSELRHSCIKAALRLKARWQDGGNDSKLIELVELINQAIRVSGGDGMLGVNCVRSFILKTGIRDEVRALGLQADVLARVSALDERLASGVRALLCADALLDEQFYVVHYADVAAAQVDPYVHYVNVGQKEGRYPVAPETVGDEQIDRALQFDSGDATARKLKIMRLLAARNVLSTADALALYRTSFDTGREDAKMHIAFEEAATGIVESWLRGESLHGIREVTDLLREMIAMLPGDATLRALLAVAMYQRGDLANAQANLIMSPASGVFAQNVRDWRARASQRMEEATRVNGAPQPACDLLLLDNSFPSEISSFRYGEFSTYLLHFDSSCSVVRPDEGLGRLGETSDFIALRAKLQHEKHIDAGRVRRFEKQALANAKVGYTVFLNQADFFFSQVGLPAANHLAFTLYPGGGFAPNNVKSDQMLRTLCDNPRVSRIITTQITSHRYLIEHGFCDPERILHIFGGIVPAVFSGQAPERAQSVNDGPLNICFVAQRYSPIGAEKGYDVFAEIVRLFANSPEVSFHVVGGFDATIIDIEPARNITFYGTRPASFFEGFYRNMDIILSPNIQLSALDPSKPEVFDGFPTTCVMEAGLQGVAMFATDFMGMNQRLDGTPIFTDREIQIIDRNPEAIAAALRRYMSDRGALRELGEAGRRAILREYSFEAQMSPRIRLLEQCMAA
ncbi:glycosyltransferase family 4 protein [Caballeronia grimmiae]|uniref:glycosyltransferase family 4 protein n=1 Tax=Caballeronia grimmiae TaxID=1071679 RepID=UPI0038BA3A38